MPPASPNSKKITVIGGGVTGLAAALTLRKEIQDAEVTLFEASDRLGGSLWTRQEDVPLADGSRGQFLVEQGADSFLIDNPATLNFLQAAGVADELIETERRHRRAFVLHRGRLLPTPPEFALLQPRRMRSLLTTSLFSFRARIRAAFELAIPRRQATGEESLADFARRRFGSQVYERLIEPLVAGIYTADGEQLSLQAALPKFAAMEQEHGSLIRAAWKSRKQTDTRSSSKPELGSGARYGLFVTPRRGMSSLVEKLAAQLPDSCVQLGRSVDRIERIDARWRITFAEGQSEPQECSAVVLATGAATTTELTAEIDQDLSQAIGDISAASSVVVSLGFQKDQIQHPLDGFGFVVPRIANRQILAASFPSVKFPGRAPENHVLIRAFLGGALRPETIDLPEERLRMMAIEELREILCIHGEPLFTHIARWRNAMPQYHLGHLQRVKTIEDRSKKLPGFGLGGNYLQGVGIPHCLRSGQLAAEEIAAEFNR